EWCADFINFMVNSVEANEILLAERGIPVNAKVSEAIQPMLSEPAQMAAQYILDIAPYVSSVDLNDPAWYGEISALLESYTERINYKEMTPIDGITAWMADANKIIESQKP
nr:carbohydrate ABC transporter substrate-binding protein [Clostridia bacterium]